MISKDLEIVHRELVKEAFAGALARVGKVIAKNPGKSLTGVFTASDVAGGAARQNLAVLGGRDLAAQSVNRSMKAMHTM
jgi:hypothetical protein